MALSTEYEHILWHKASFRRYTKTKIITFSLSDQYRLKLYSNNNKNNRKFTNSWKLDTSTEWKIGQDRNKENKIEDFLELDWKECTSCPNI